MTAGRGFRQWVYEQWQANSEELLAYGQGTRTAKEYFHLYKYWLKNRYREYTRITA